MDDEDFGEFGFASKKISAKGAFGRDQGKKLAKLRKILKLSKMNQIFEVEDLQ